ncbi:hypothetical protein IW261DRAFT_723067 [Armillaria novae-zelandiae]|uniref:Uncharacterized protein n=1 Tax=Armillaria novae-zelandiae TaxID=153914 RepID=A0AA39TXR7_9AGAR|nr:hypothetical protein IW261DRAFT_723067 [Armillaria novae-zelandiae]
MDRRRRLYSLRPHDMPGSMFMLRALTVCPLFNTSLPWSQMTVSETSCLSVCEESFIIRNAPLLLTLVANSRRVDRHSISLEAMSFEGLSSKHPESTSSQRSLKSATCHPSFAHSYFIRLLRTVRRTLHVVGLCASYKPTLRFLFIRFVLEHCSLSDNFIRRLGKRSSFSTDISDAQNKDASLSATTHLSIGVPYFADIAVCRAVVDEDQ